MLVPIQVNDTTIHIDVKNPDNFIEEIKTSLNKTLFDLGLKVIERIPKCSLKIQVIAIKSQ